MRLCGHRGIVQVMVAGLVLVAGLRGAAEEGVVVELEVDGRVEAVLTRSRTVADLLLERQISLRPEDAVFPPLATPLAPGIRVTVVRAIPVRIRVDGRIHSLRTLARTPREVLEAVGIRLQSLDRVSPPLDAPLESGSEIRVQRVREETEVVRETVPFPVTYRVVRALFARGAEVIQPGRPGVVERRYRIIRVDGQVVRREKVGHRVILPPQPQVVRIGRGYIPSRGELIRRPSLVVTASAYAPYGDRGVDAVTATGLRARHGVIAVDPRVIPLGTVVYVEGYGTAIAADTGGAIRGLRIDVCFNSVREALRWGRRRVRVWILGQ
ncbi:MAG: 3D domain-containing protein [Armatimonadota bacterium]|nr:3D domain-containing protein [Armatimonadota bacterium]